MSADFNKPIQTDNYLDVLNYIRDNIISVSKQDYTSASNIPNGAVRYNTTGSVFEKYNGSTWDEIGSFAHTNVWTGSNTFTSTMTTASILAGDTTGSYNIGSASNYFGNGFFGALTLNGNDLSTTLSGFAKLSADNDFTGVNTFNSILPKDNNSYIGGTNNVWNNIYTTTVTLSSNVRLDTAASGQAGEFFWYNSDANASAAMQLVGSCVRAFSGTGGTIDLGNQYIPWRNAYLHNIYPTSDDNSYDIGTSSIGYRRIYTGALRPNATVGTLINSGSGYYNTGLTLYSDMTHDWGVNVGVFTGGNPVFRPVGTFSAGGVYLGNQDKRWYTMWTLDTHAYCYRFYAPSSHTTERGYLQCQDDGNLVLRKNSYGTINRITVINNSGGVILNNGATAWTSASDIRLKDNIEPITSALNIITQLKPVKYSLKEQHMSYADKVGFIAQEVQKILPEVVQGKESEDEYLGITYTDFIPFIIKAIQELSTKVDALK